MFFAANKCVCCKSSMPVTCRFSRPRATRGKCLKKEIFTSAKSTFALRFLLISFFASAVIFPLKKKGAAKAATNQDQENNKGNFEDFLKHGFLFGY